MTRRGPLLMETGLSHDYFWNVSGYGERYYFHMEGHMQSKIEPHKVRLKQAL